MDTPTALFANEAFYLAFSQHDLDAMERLWAKQLPVLCLHPGWPALIDRESIMASWQNILQNPAIGIIVPHYAKALLYDNLATVVCYEQIQGDMLVATNTFLLEAGEIRIVQHQAAPCAQPPTPERSPVVAMQ